MALKRAVGVMREVVDGFDLTSESVEGSALTLQSVDDIHGGDGLSLGVLGVSDGISDDVLKEDLEDTTGLFVDESRDTFDSTTASQATDSGLGDTLDVITQDLAMTLRASLTKSFSSFTTSSHDAYFLLTTRVLTDLNARAAYLYSKNRACMEAHLSANQISARRGKSGSQ